MDYINALADFTKWVLLCWLGCMGVPAVFALCRFIRNPERGL